MLKGEIWKVKLDPTVGSEINKIRPALIVNRTSFARLPQRIIVPITTWQEKFLTAPWMIKIIHSTSNGLTFDSAIDTFQVRSVDVSRLLEKLGSVDNQIMCKVLDALKNNF